MTSAASNTTPTLFLFDFTIESISWLWNTRTWANLTLLSPYIIFSATFPFCRVTQLPLHLAIVKVDYVLILFCNHNEVFSCDLLVHADYTVHGVLQVRILERVAVPFSRGSSQPRDRTQVSCIASGFFTSWVTREALQFIYWFELFQ